MFLLFTKTLLNSFLKYKYMFGLVSSFAQSCPLFVTPWTAAYQASLSIINSQLTHITNSQLAQTQIHWVSDAIQPSYPLSFPSPPAFYPAQHQSLFQWISSLHQVTKALASVLPVNTQDWFPLGWTGLIFLQSKGLSRVFSNTRVQKH